MRLEILPLLIHRGGLEFNLAETQVAGTKQVSFQSWKAAKGGLSNFEAPKLIGLVSFCQFLGRILVFSKNKQHQ
ncbi:unnamed protein product [Coffea canephora]|uniref:Uncharacterized protein n=1 Tax=Coffea canephora TaxID=49390 RepID=A0A068U0Y3_COFCA|nr:unnamed protein product [Coffea canephora]